MYNHHEPRNITFTIRYTFNKARSKYKGTGAGTAEKRRMQMYSASAQILLMKVIENYNKVIVNNRVKLVVVSLCKEVFEKFGERQLISRGEYFTRSGDVMEYAGQIVSGVFKYSLMSSDGNNRVIGFFLDDSLLIDYESVMHSTKMRTHIIALEDSEVIVIPAKILREELNRDHELNMNR